MLLSYSDQCKYNTVLYDSMLDLKTLFRSTQAMCWIIVLGTNL